MGCGHLIPLLSSPSRPSLLKQFTPFFCNPIKRYGQASKDSHIHIMEERAPSTAEEFQRVAEEKLKEAKQGVASQTFEKTYDGVEEATVGDSKVESVKERYKRHEPGTDYLKRPPGDE
ncbi:hypothetical protein O6P43_013661 [Quillaja saponaria]|uniref:Uncharacterized protein n=1 Tax=Quillaja saponaria TaxID=32244 RepID=A0AAD7PQF8_QUISA|nr:hypothetical protein O6P43_013661 [Quillaja saponaria]